MRFLLAATIVLFASCLASGQSVKMPEKLEAKPGRMTSLEITYEGADPQFLVLGCEVDYFREVSAKPDTIALRLVSYGEQTFTVVAWCVKGDKSSPPATCKVTVKNPAPPIPPAPVDPLQAELKRLYDADTTADKAATVQTLARVYRLAAKASMDRSVLTVAVLVETLTAVLSELPDASLQAVRKRVSAELAKALPLDDGPLDDTARKSVSDAYIRVASILEGLGK